MTSASSSKVFSSEHERLAHISHQSLLLAATLADSSQNNAYALGVAGLVAPYIGIAILGFLSKCIVSSHVDKLRHNLTSCSFLLRLFLGLLLPRLLPLSLQGMPPTRGARKRSARVWKDTLLSKSTTHQHSFCRA